MTNQIIQKVIEIGCSICGTKEKILCESCRKADIIKDIFTQLKEIKLLLNEYINQNQKHGN